MQTRLAVQYAYPVPASPARVLITIPDPEPQSIHHAPKETARNPKPGTPNFEPQILIRDVKQVAVQYACLALVSHALFIPAPSPSRLIFSQVPHLSFSRSLSLVLSPFLSLSLSLSLSLFFSFPLSLCSLASSSHRSPPSPLRLETRIFQMLVFECVPGRSRHSRMTLRHVTYRLKRGGHVGLL